MAGRKSYRFPYTKYPAVRLALCLMAGILLSGIAGLKSSAVLLITLVLCLISLGLFFLVNRKLKVVFAPWETICFLLLVVMLGWLRGASADQSAGPPWESEFLPAFQADTLSWYGRVDEATVNSNGTLSIFLHVDSLGFGGDLPKVRRSFRTQIRFFRASDSEIETVRPGSYVQLYARPTEIPEPRNPHDFDVRSWLNSEGVYISGVGTGVGILIQKPSPLHWGWWRNLFRDGIDQVFSAEQAPLAKAIMIGYRAGLDREVREGFSRAGLAHLMAVSGMHVGFLLFPLWLIIPYFWGSATGRAAGLITIVVVLFFYAGITGFAPSVQRASVFAFFVAFARLYQRRRDPVNLTGLAALIILLVDPQSIYAVGFQMSFIAVLTIFLMIPVIQRLFPPKIRYKWHVQAVQLFLVSVCIQLALFPILVQMFHEFSLIGPVMNSIAAPLTQVLFIWGFAASILGFLLPETAAFLNVPADFMVAALEWMTLFSASLPGAFISTNLPSVWIYLIWLAFFGLISVWFNPALRWKWAVLLLLGIGLYQAERVYTALTTEPGVKITFFDVGQGDAVLIETPSGKNILYDTGVITPFGNSGDRVLVPHLRAAGIRSLDAVILSHPHADHIGGILALMDAVDIDAIYDPGFEYHTAIFAGYRKAAADRDIPIIEVRKGDRIDLDPAMPILVLGPHSELSSSNPNEHSIILKILYGEDVLLLTGDAETQAERLTARQFGDFLNADLLKAGHHGSRTSSHTFFLDYVEPEKVVVSNALRNRYDHPHAEAAWRLTQTGADVHYTALNGARIFKMTGSGILKKEWR